MKNTFMKVGNLSIQYIYIYFLLMLVQRGGNLTRDLWFVSPPQTQDIQ